MAVEVTVDKIHDPELIGLMQILKLVTDPLHVEAVGGDKVRPPLDEVLRLLPRDVADRGEDVRQVGRRPLQAVSVVDLPLARLHVHVEVLMNINQSEASKAKPIRDEHYPRKAK